MAVGALAPTENRSVPHPLSQIDAMRNLSVLVLGQPSQFFCLFALPCELRVPQPCAAWGLIVANGRRARPKLVPILPDQGNLSRVALGKVLEVFHQGVGRLRELLPRILQRVFAPRLRAMNRSNTNIDIA